MAGRDSYRYKNWQQAGYVVQRLLGEDWVVLRHAQAWVPPTDVYENEHGLIVRVEIAGIEEKDFDVTLHERLLVIEGVRRDDEPKQVYHQMEMRFGAFRTEIFMPWLVENDLIEATYEQGVLRVTLPRPPARRVTVNE